MDSISSSYIQSELLLSNTSIAHFFSTRLHGFSTGVAQSLNMGFTTEDLPQNTISNRKKLLEMTNMPFDKLTTVNQIHGDEIITITNNLAGAGHDIKPSPAGNADALITNLPQVPIMVLTADCVPILLLDPLKKVIAAIHAGWRGTVAGIAAKTVDAMQAQFGTDPSDIIAAIGPSIGPCCYEVGIDVVTQATKTLSDASKSICHTANHYYFDLWDANRRQLNIKGVSINKIEKTGYCTKCRSQIFFSSRADGGITGRMGACIMLR